MFQLCCSGIMVVFCGGLVEVCSKISCGGFLWFSYGGL